MYKRGLRRISQPLSKAFISLKVSPNNITRLSGIAGFAGAVLMIYNPIAGWLLLHLYSVLDSCDGQVARMTNNVTAYGDYLDTITHPLVEAAMIMSMGGPAALIAMFLDMFRHIKRRLGKKIGKESKGSGIINNTNMMIWLCLLGPWGNLALVIISVWRLAK